MSIKNAPVATLRGMALCPIGRRFVSMDAQEYVPMEHAMNAIVHILRMASRLVFLHAAGGWGG